jgi:type III pantothenate kinase
MLLVLDVGNSHTTIGVYQGDDLIADWRIVTSIHRTADELGIMMTMLLQQSNLAPSDMDACCVSSVVPPMNAALEQMARTVFGVEPLMVGPGIKTGLVIQVDNPKEVGADRIVTAVAAIEAYGEPLIVIDFGTATTFDAIGANAEYRGGLILPGIQISADALFERCAKLPRVDIVKPPNVIGRDTVTSIRSALTYGYADLVDGIVARMSDEMGVQSTVVATGGLADVIADIATRIDHVDNSLLLKGLKAIHAKNARTM